jgi:hypothetical protein
MTLLAYKILPAMLALTLALAGTGGGVALAADSVPGDILYPLKLAVEDVRLLLSFDPGQEADLAMSFATERVREMERLVLRGEQVPDSTVARMTRQMERAMAEIALAQPKEVPALLQRLMERTQTQLHVLQRLQTMAQEQSQTRLRTAAQVMERAHQAAGAGLTDPQQFRQEYQHRYQGSLGPQEQPAPAREPQQPRNEYQNRNETTTGPAGEPTGTPVQEREQSRKENQNRNEGEACPTPTVTPTCEQEQYQHEYQHQNEGTAGPHDDHSPEPTESPNGPSDDQGSPAAETPRPGSGPDQSGQSGNGH